MFHGTKQIHVRFRGVTKRPALVAIGAALGIACGVVLSVSYAKYARRVDEKLASGLIDPGSALYAAPRTVAVGQESSVAELESYLQRSGYVASEPSKPHSKDLGWYSSKGNTIEIHPGPEAYISGGSVIETKAGRIARITAADGRTRRDQLLLEPEVITNLFDQSREKQLIVRFDSIPKVLVEAVLAAEDKRFFHHSGFDLKAILRAAWIDLKERRRSQGASTLTQQLARTLWLGPDRGWRRKIPESLITFHLEHTLTKQQIFEDYANSIYLGHVGSFSIHGFGEASRMYLGKDLSQVSLADAALLAGLIQAPYARNPFRYPDRAEARRNVILKAMRANGYVTQADYEAAVRSPLRATVGEEDSSGAPYFVDLVNEELQTRFPDRDFQNSPSRVYTTLDSDLQSDAIEAVRIGIQETDAQWKRRSKVYGAREMPAVQVALVALDAETGEVKALVGGRNYGTSQFNHATAERQPGSTFKPFVYAAALSAGLSDSRHALTAATLIDDEPTTFMFRGETYEPADYDQPYAGEVTLRFALAHSLNIPAVKAAEAAGYDKVARLARAAGLPGSIDATPSIALGTYEVTPLELAEAYTIFPNYGNRVKLSMIRSIRGPRDSSIFESKPERKPVIDPRVAYVMDNMMEEVLRSGTGGGARSRGFYLPAAGKTGTSRDGWFAGFTSRLICVVWVGFDDNRDIKLEGARSALPIWTEFMKRAHQRPGYRNVHEFVPPKGIVTVDIDADTGEIAAPNCPNRRSEVFVDGTQPAEICHLHGARTPVARPPQPGHAGLALDLP